MPSQFAKVFTEQVMNAQLNPVLYGDNSGAGNHVTSASTDTFTRSRSREFNTMEPISSSSYTLASDVSNYSNEVDLWVRSNETENAGVQNSRVAVVQRSTLAPSTSLDSGVWYMMAMILPIFSVNNCLQWTCTPSTMLGAAEFFLSHLSRFCGRTRAQMRRLAQDQIARDLFATAMDIVLVVYAIGFLLLSLYQASIIG